MAFFKAGETPSEEPFTRHLSPLQVAQSVQTALDACWQILPQSGKTLDALRRAVWEKFLDVENWWMNLSDRAAHKIVEASQIAFRMPAAHLEAAQRGELTHEQFFLRLPEQSLADAIFWAWLLQPKDARDPARTITIVRSIIDRQLRNADQDLSTFS
jgi:hypothetical protein